MRRTALAFAAVTCTAMLAAVGCHARRYTPPEQPMPPNTVLLTQMMRQLSAQPGFTEAVLKELEGSQNGAKKGLALLTPELIHHMRELILGKDWHGLDRFPGWTMREINPTVRVAGHVAGKDTQAEDLAARHPGAPSGATQPASATKASSPYLDLGPYDLNRVGTVDLTQPSPLPGFSTKGLVTSLGDDVTRGDGPSPQLAPEHARSQQIADVLNRLSVNADSGTPGFTAKIGAATAITPEALIDALLASGHTLEIGDARYFANFGHFHYRGQDVMMPFWLNSQIAIPGAHGRALLVPAAHAEYEWRIRGPHVNADISWYFGIDGKAEFRTMDTEDQPWVQKRDAHTYTGADAREVTRLVGRMTLAYMHLHDAYPALPFGGYYALGVCQDGIAAVELKMTGHTTLFPNTADSSLFTDPRDAEINRLIAAIPKDRNGAKPQAERIFGSLPVNDDDAGLRSIMIPGLADDLIATRNAWQSGDLERTHGLVYRVARDAFVVLAGAGTILLVLLVLRRRRAVRLVAP
jgi:hypothetical protein